MKGRCFDKNVKVTLRKYEYDNSTDEFLLCKKHCNDPDFSNFISETPINQTSNSEVLQN